MVTLWAYDVAPAPPLAPGSPTSLTAHAPPTSTYVRWTAPSPSPGQSLTTPDPSTVPQEVVERADWAAGETVGLVIDGTPTEDAGWQTVANLASGTPARLNLVYAVAGSGPGSPPASER